MTQTPIPQALIEAPKQSGWRERSVGILALCLVFLASASFTWAYLGDSARSQAPRQQLAAAESSAAQVPPAPDAFASTTLKAQGAIVVDITTHRTLYELNPDVQLPLASLTKVPLVLVVLSALPADTIVTMPPYVPRFAAGTHWKISDIVNYTLAISSNNMADVLAQSAEEAIRTQFPDAPAGGAAVWRMNQLARQLGLTHTYFLNDNGLDEGTTQGGAYGSARDMAVLFAYADSTMRPSFAATTQQSFVIESQDGARAVAINTDEALPAIPGLRLGKTGFTDLAGGNLAVVFEESGHDIVAVVLGSTLQGRFDDMKILVARSKDALASER